MSVTCCPSIAVIRTVLVVVSVRVTSVVGVAVAGSAERLDAKSVHVGRMILSVHPASPSVQLASVSSFSSSA